MVRDGARQPRQLRRLQKIRCPRIHRRAIRRRVGSHRGRVRAARRGVQNAQPSTAYRHQPRFAKRPHNEPLRRHAAGHGGERSGVRPHRARSRLPQFQVLDEIQQPEGDDRVLPTVSRALGQAGGGLELSAAPGCHRGRRRRGWPHQERDRHRLAAVRRPGRHDPRFTHRGFAQRDRRLQRPARTDSRVDQPGRRDSGRAVGLRPVRLCAPCNTGDRVG